MRFPWDFSPAGQPVKLKTRICPPANIIVSIKNNIIIYYFIEDGLVIIVELLPMKNILTSLKNILHKENREIKINGLKWPKEHRSEYRNSKMV